LAQGKPASGLKVEVDEKETLDDFWLLSSKQTMFLLNVKEGSDLHDIEGYVKAFEERFGENVVIVADVKLIGELSEMNEQEQEEYLALFESKPTLVEDVISAGFKRLNLITFYTGNEKEVNAWAIEQGATVKEAAGVIHTDLGERFITADVVNVEKMIEAGGWVGSKEKGLVRNQSKDYIVLDGDYINVLAN